MYARPGDGTGVVILSNSDSGNLPGSMGILEIKKRLFTDAAKLCAH
ncbi:MAG: hypothetical protein WC889_07635 [Myxococcota bacterium]|jgi:hypothetical protein